tara:strand:- start:642 stop:962 length:321 start_codon:yes stop_codon:yes gene_type:complete
MTLKDFQVAKDVRFDKISQTATHLMPSIMPWIISCDNDGCSTQIYPQSLMISARWIFYLEEVRTWDNFQSFCSINCYKEFDGLFEKVIKAGTGENLAAIVERWDDE